jgi:hypothetical protein
MNFVFTGNFKAKSTRTGGTRKRKPEADITFVVSPKGEETYNTFTIGEEFFKAHFHNPEEDMSNSVAFAGNIWGVFPDGQGANLNSSKKGNKGRQFKSNTAEFQLYQAGLLPEPVSKITLEEIEELTYEAGTKVYFNATEVAVPEGVDAIKMFELSVLTEEQLLDLKSNDSSDDSEDESDDLEEAEAEGTGTGAVEAASDDVWK